MTEDLHALEGYLIEENKEEDTFTNNVLQDFWICCLSREMSLLGRKEVLTGKAKFGILGDGKEVPQVAMARAFKKGDWRAGYYRDQTFMMALGLCSMEAYFAQLYADPENDPFSGGRQMNSHFASRTVDENGDFLDLVNRYNISSDVSSTGGQMARGFGLAFASKKYRQFDRESDLTRKGAEVSFMTIGDASTSEGVFWEAMNAAVVEQVPMALSVWDDGYGISVPKKYQTAKSSISDALSGMLKDDDRDGLLIYVCKAWDYPGLVEMYEKGVSLVRKHQMPALFHIEECTQPQGHSTSGSHERYKSKERLQWEKDYDCIEHMAKWITSSDLANDEKLDTMRARAKEEAKKARDRAWKASQSRAIALRDDVSQLISSSSPLPGMESICNDFRTRIKKEIHASVSESIAIGRQLNHQLIMAGHGDQASKVQSWLGDQMQVADEHYHTHLYSSTPKAAVRVPVEAAVFSSDSPMINGYQILNRFFDTKLASNPSIIAFGEDLGRIGDVNQGFAGLQEKYGEDRVFDVGIREWTIMGQAIGAAMRGLRPIAEIQYLDYLIYGLEPLSDDLASLRYRSNGKQAAPAIIRTRGHRLEGIWHAGSPIGMLLGSLRGICLCVPRNMTQAAGMYATLLASDDPGIVIEPLNGYRLKERQPDNLDTFSVPLGVPEVLNEGTDLTLVTYGSCVQIAQRAVEILENYDVLIELIDVQTLLPFDLEGVIVHSLKKTNRILFMDEDVPGGGTAFMMQEVLEKQDGYHYLDSPVRTLTARSHRTPYGSDGDYFSKPNAEDVVERVLEILHEVRPDVYPSLAF